MFVLKNKVILMSGGCSGIGFKIAKNLLSGVDNRAIKGLVILDYNVNDDVRSKFKKITKEDRLRLIECDVSNHKQVENGFESAVKTFGALDVVINNAGIFDEQNIAKTVNINLTAVLFATELAVKRYLPKYRSTEEAIVINTASILGLTYFKFTPTYVATKHGVIALGKCYADEYNTSKVRVMSLCPGFTKTPLTTDLKLREDDRKECESLIADIQMQDPVNCVEAVLTMIADGKPGSAWIVNKGDVREAIFNEPFQFNEVF